MVRLAVLALLLSSLAHAGPWVDQAPGHGYVSLGFSEYEASQYLAGPCAGSCPGSPPGSPSYPAPPHKAYGQRSPITIPQLSNADGETANLSSIYRNQSLQFYGEVSLWKGLGFVAQMPLVERISQQLDAGALLANVSAGDLVTGLKYQIPTHGKLAGFAFGPQVYITAPTGEVSATGVYPGALKPLNNAFPLPSGNGTVDIETRLSTGYSFYPVPAFVIAEVGLHHHFDDATCRNVAIGGDSSDRGTQRVTYSDDVPWTVQLGGTYEPPKHLAWLHHVTFIGSVHGVKSLENGFIDKSGLPAYARPCGQSNNATFISAGAQIMIFPIKHLGVTYSVEHVLSGGNVGYGLTQTAGLAAQF